MTSTTSENQCTLRSAVKFSGIGLHTGIRAHLSILPADQDTGIVVRRVDVEGCPEGPAIATNVTDVMRSTTICCGDSSVKLVEHVFAALYGLGVDNAVIEMDGPEPPVADGSSIEFVDAINSVGIKKQNSPREVLTISEPVVAGSGENYLIFMPPEEPGEFRISCTVHYGVCKLDTQYLSLPITPVTFAEELSKARTFCEDYKQIEGLMKAGLIRGASLDNAMVVCDGAVVSKDGLRYDTELVRHKMLDIVGDLSLVGRRLCGHLIALKPGHPLNVDMAQKLMSLIE